jgi:hypothetical protein
MVEKSSDEEQLRKLQIFVLNFIRKLSLNKHSGALKSSNYFRTFTMNGMRRTMLSFETPQHSLNSKGTSREYYEQSKMPKLLVSSYITIVVVDEGIEE